MKTRSTFQAFTGWIASFLVCAGLLFASLTASAQLTGTKTVGAGGDYATIELAIADLNTLGVGPGGVIFDVAAGHAETLSSTTAGTITATGTAANPIVFQKSGAGANPVITAFAWTAATAFDGMIKIAGGDYIIFDGIDLQENSANTTNRTDWGYALVKGSATAPFNGCQYVTIKNCNITLDKANTTAIGIYTGNHIATATTSLTLTAAADAMSNCTFLNNVISNVYIGISLNGFSTATLYDLNNVVSQNQISNFGGGSATPYGIYSIYNGDLTVSNNTISGGAGTTSTMYGIFCSTATSKNISITGNSVTITSDATTSAMYGISNSVGSTAASNTVTISGNSVINCTRPAATTGLFHAIVNSATAATVNIFNNLVDNNLLPGTGAFIGIYNSAALGTNPLNMYGNTVTNNSKTGTSGTLYGCQATTATINFYQNIISDNSIAGGSSALYGYYNVGSPVTETYHSNQIFNLTHAGTGTTVGLQISTASGTKNVYNNQIYNLTSGGTVSGYASGYGSPANIYKNSIFNLTSTSTGTTAGTVNGVLITGGSMNVYNNYISQLNAPNVAATDGIRGISITSTSSSTSHKIYYNTIYLDATSTGANFGTSGLFHTYSATATSSALDMRNNIIVNNSTPAGTGNTVAFRRSAATSLANISNDCNNNCLYAGAPGPNNLLFFDGTNADQTIAAYKTRVLPRESASFSELPPFNDVSSTPYNLHLTASTPTQCENGGQILATITDDFDGNIRAGSSGYPGTGTLPDVGADEGEFTGLDLLPPTITYSTLGNTPYTTDRTLTATITDASGIPVSGTGLPVLYWNVNAGGYTPAAGVFVSGTTYSFTFGAGVTIGDVIGYYIVAQDNASPAANMASNPSTGASGFTQDPPAAATPPTTPNTYTIVPSISGVFHIGTDPGADYPTITAAVADYNTKSQTGPVTFILDDPNYSAGETFPIVINQNSGSSSSNTLTIKPGTGVNSTISGSSTTSIFKLNGCDYFTIDGSNNGTGSKDLTIENQDATASTAAIWISSPGAGQGCQFITVKNCNLLAGGNINNTYGIMAGGTSIAGGGLDHSNISILNNTIERAKYGVYANGSALANIMNNLTVQDNIIGSDNATNYVTGYGIYGTYLNNTLVKGNKVYNFIYDGSKYGIYMATTCNNTVITQNRIHSFGQTNTTATYYANGIYIATGSTGVNISNNLIYDLNTYGSTNVYYKTGIRIIGCTNVSVYFNTVRLSGTFGSATASLQSACMYISSAVTTLDIRNNIFTNITSGTTPLNFTLHTVSSNTGLTIDYNDYYSTGTVLGYYGANVADFTAWKSATLQDLNSKNVNPNYESETDLTPSAIDLHSTGVTIPTIPGDFFGVLRTSPPDIGAIEFTPALNDAGVASIASPLSLTTIGITPVLVNLKNFGLNPLTSVNINFEVNGGGVNTYLWTGNLASGAVQSNINIGNFNFTDYNSTIKAWTTLPNNVADEEYINDTSQTSLYVCNPFNGIYTLGGAGADYPTFAEVFDKLNTCGVSGPVVFNVAADYTEAITLAASPNNVGLKLNATGTAVNTITFQKDGAGANPLITFTGTTATTDVGIWLNGSDYVTFDGIDINDAGSAMDRGFYLAGSATNGCEGNVIKNCGITLSNTSANTNPTGVYMLSTATAASGKNSNNKFLNNTISNVFYGYRINGVSTTYYDMGNMIGIENNGTHTIQNIGYSGSATTHGINFSFQDGIEIGNVKIYNIQNTTTTSPNNCGIQIPGACANINLHHIWIDLMNGGEPYGINFGAACTGINTFNNNLFENITATAGNLNIFRNEGTALGTMSIYNNTFRNMTHNAAANSIEGLYLNSASTFNVYNNQLYGWTNNGTGAANINPLNIQNASNNSTVYNNLIFDMKAPSSTASPSTKCIRVNAGTVKLYHNTLLLNYTSLVAGNSSAAIHVSAVPTSLEMANNIIINKCDMTTGTRAVAFWWPSTTYTALSTNTNNNIYYAGVPGTNNLIFYNGTNSDQTLLDYQTRMVTRDQASNTEDVPFVNSTSAPWDLHIQQLIPTLAESQGKKIALVTQDIDGELRFGEPGYAGTGVAVDIGADEITGVPIFTCAAPAPGNTVASSGVICFGQNVNLSLQNPTPGTGVAYQWQESTDGVTYTNITGATGSTHSVTPAVPMWYQCNVTCYNGPVTTTATPVGITFATDITGTTPGTRCGVGTVTLGATASAGTVYWYTNPTGGVPIGTGNTLITPVINTTTNFYASAANTAPASIVLGAGSTASTSAGQTFLPGGWGGTKTQYIIRASELIGAGLSAGPITSLGFTPTTSGQTYQGFYVNIGHTNDATAPATTFIATGLTQVYAGTLADDAYTPVANTLNTLTFGTGTGSSPVFVWDGVSNLVVSISWSLVPSATTSTGSTMLVDNVGFTASAYRQRDSYTPAAMLAETSVNSTTAFRPQFTINGIAVCSGPRVPVVATVTPAPAITATAGSSNLCLGQSTTLSVTSPNDPNYTYTWNPGQLMGDAQTITPTVSTTYTVMAVDNSGLGNNGCVNTASVTVAVHPVPSPVVVTPSTATTCPGQIVQLSATGGNIGGQPSPIGTGTVQNSGTTYPTPYGAYYETVRQQYLVLASELVAAGIQPGASLSSLTFDVGALNGSGVHIDFKIRMAHTSVTALAIPLITPSLQLVYGPVNYQPLLGSNLHTFSTPFAWDGTSNLLVDICFANDPTGLGGNLYSNNASANSTNTSFNSAAWIYSDDADYCGLTSATNSGSGTARANMLFGASGATNREWTPQAGLYTDAGATLPYTGGAASTIYAKPGPGSYTYTYTSTTPQNCSNSGSSTITVHPLPTATTTLAATEYICPGDSKTLTVDLTGTPPWSLTVNDGTGPVVVSGIMTSPWTYVVSPAVATTYTVSSVTDVNCTNAANISVMVDLHPVPAPVITGYQTPICPDDKTILDAGNMWTSYLWSTPTIGQTWYWPTLWANGYEIGSNASAVWTVTVTNQFGCAGSASVTISTFPSLTTSAGQDAAICEGQSTQLDANGIGGGGTFQYAWSPAAGLSATNVKNPIANPVVTTTYTVTVTDNNNCVAEDEVIVTVYPAVVVDFTGLNTAYCIDAPVAMLTGTPTGGIFSGPGIVGNTFDPALAGVGGPYTITYTYTDVNNCVWSITKSVTVNPLPLVSYTGLMQAYCVDAASATLVGTPAGGTFSGPGISGNVFTPATAGTGTHTITYTYTDGNGCTNSFSAQTTVNPLPVVSFTGLNNLYCITAPVSNLVGTPAGGTFSGPGVLGNTFDPVLAGVGGPYTITYTYTDGNNCTASITKQTNVTQQLVASFTGLSAAYCINAPAATLTGTPAGGIFSGPGISGNTFSPALAGVGGPHTITYTYSDGVACTSVVTKEVTVNPLPVVSFTGLMQSCCVDAAPATLAGTPAGGTFSGPGISGNVFNPATAGAGTHTITYTYTDGNGCTNSSSQSVVVHPLPVLTVAPIANSYCIDAAPVILSGTPSGGIWSGPGVSGNQFIAGQAGTGIKTLTFSYTDGNGCFNSTTLTTTVHDLPVVNFPSLPGICVNAAPMTLYGGTPAGGTYSGIGVTAGVFNPAVPGAGNTTLTYTYTDGNGCTNSATTSIQVNPIDQLTFPPLTGVCVDAAILPLNTATPAGGNYSGPGVTGWNIFDPAAAGAGIHTLTYTYTNQYNCTNSITQTIQVYALPVLTMSPAAVICAGFSAPISVSASGAGGFTYLWNNAGTLNNAAIAYPIAAPVVNTTYTVTVTDVNLCQNTGSVSVTVNPLPVVSFSGLNSAYCVDAPAATLTGTPAGGTFTGPGIAGNQFNPSLAGVGGPYTITYTYTDLNQCTNGISSTTLVNALPVVTFSGLDAHYCTNSPIVTLTGNPAGGTFSGPGISGNQFAPGTAGIGTHQITYTYTDGNGCTNSKTLSTLVDPIPAVSFSTLSQICVNAAQINLTGGLPMGGTYSGPGVTAGNFDPTAAGSGIKTLTYTYTDGNNCTNFATHNILVHALTPLTFPALAGVCITEAPFALNTATPAGGTYSGTGITANMFDPAAAGAGTHTLTYTFTDGNNCTNSITQTIQVYALPNVVMSSNTSICIGGTTQLNVTPFGGGGGYSFLWNNGTLLNSATISNPVATPVNTTTFTVTVTDIRGCKRTGSTTITVNPLPALTLNPATNMCQGSNTQLNVQVMPAGTYAYSWSNGASLSSTTIANPVATPAVSTTYTVTVTNTSTSCVSTAQTVVTVLPNPIPAITGLNANYCLSAAPVTLTGNPAGGVFTINGIPAVQLDPAITGVGGHTVTYSVTQANNCVASINQTVNVRALPVADAGQDQSVCTGFQVNLNASASGGAPPYQYLWSPAALVSNPNIANPVTNPATTTTYTVVITDLYGCSSSDQVVVNTTSTPVANAGLDVTICKGQGAQLQASGGTTYAWVPSTGLNNANISDPIASPTVTTTYSVIVVSNCGIAADQVVVTVLPLPSVNFTGLPANACINGTPVTLTGIPAGGVFSGPGITGNVFDPAQAGGPGIVDISYTISGSNGCDNTITKSVNVRPLTIGVINNLAPLYCASGNAVTLSGIPAGGTFAGPGMAGNMFNPAMAGVGVHTIIYTFSDQYGCLNTITQQTTVYSPAVNITNLAPDYCVNGAAVTLTGTPAGGTFTGTGMNGSKFVPSVAGVGTHAITYTATDGSGCKGSVTLSTVVLPPTPVSFTGLAPTYCTNDPIATLTPSPAGGTFSGPGIVGNTFNPATSSTGTRVIWYTVSGPGFCKNSVTQTTVVSPVPAVSFSGLNNSYCVSALPVNLSFAPAGGTFTGNGMTGNVFTPAAAGPGNHTITYSFTSPAGCTNSMTKTTLVNPLPVVSFSGLNATYCINDGPALLTGSPAGGYFNGPGIQYGIYFNPALAGIGTHTITYSYKDVNQCTNIASAMVTVTALPTATFQIPAGVCIDAAPVTLIATPAGGTFTGPGVVNGIFYPNLAGTGVHTLTYSITNVGGCSGTITTTIQVYALPSVTFSYVKTNHCNNAAPVTLSGNPAGGTFTGNGMVGNVFHPALAGVGTHVITYTFTNANGCTNFATRTLNVIAAPVVSFTGLASAYCINEPTVTLTGTPAGGYFSGPGAGLTSFSPLSAGPGTHTITYTLSLNGCTSTASQQVTVNPLPVVSFMNIPSSYCINQGPLTLNATPAGGTFTFSGNGLTGNVLDPVVAGVGGYNLFYAYTDPVTGCSRTIKMVIYIRPVSAASLIGPATVCQSGAPVVMSGSPATPAGIYTGPGMSGNLFNPGVAGAGTHTVTYNYTNGFGCVSMANHSVTVLAGPTLTLPATSTVCSNQTITLTADPGAASYQWSTGASTQSIVVDGAVLGLGTHNISVTATNAQGCSSTATTVLSVISCKIDGTAAITESVTAYPNPSSGIYKLTLSHFTGNTEMSVFNELGQIITRETLQTGEGDTFIKELDLSVLPSGVYTVKFTNEKATRAIKLILQ